LEDRSYSLRYRRNNIKVNLKYTGCGSISRIAAAHNWAQC